MNLRDFLPKSFGGKAAQVSCGDYRDAQPSAAPAVPPISTLHAETSSQLKTEAYASDDDSPIQSGLVAYDSSSDSEAAEVGPSLPVPLTNDGDDDSIGPSLPVPEADDSLERSAPIIQNVNVKLPISHEAIISCHSKSVSSLSVDAAGARMLTGSLDYKVNLFNFSGMDSSMLPFRSIEPCGQCPITCVAFSNTGDRFAVCSPTAAPRLFDRDGHLIAEWPTGDMYLTDMSKTAGHIGAVSHLMWHPSAAYGRHTLMTGGQDGTIRLWGTDSVETAKSNGQIGKVRQAKVIRCKDAKGHRSEVSVCCYSGDAEWIVAGCADGSLQAWRNNPKAAMLRPDTCHRDAHAPGKDTISCIVFNPKSCNILATRGILDSSVKLWNIVHLKECLGERTDLAGYHIGTECAWSPDGNVIAVGVGNGSSLDHAAVELLDGERLTRLARVGVSGCASVVKLTWPDKLNQLIVGMTDGSVRILYDVDSSTNGALLCARRRPRARDPLDIEMSVISASSAAVGEIFTSDWEAIKATRSKGKGGGSKRKRDDEQMKRPEAPITGVGHGGRLGASRWTPFIMERTVKLEQRDVDPREALLKYADQASSDPMFVAPAFKVSQPVPVFNEDSNDDDDNDK